MRLLRYALLLGVALLICSMIYPSYKEAWVASIQADIIAPLCGQIRDGQTIVWNANRACWQPVTPASNNN